MPYNKKDISKLVKLGLLTEETRDAYISRLNQHLKGELGEKDEIIKSFEKEIHNKGGANEIDLDRFNIVFPVIA